jgi:Glycosyltransferase
MKVVHLIFSFQTGGAEAMLVDIMNEQSKAENVTLIVINNLINESLIQKINPLVSIVRINRRQSSKNPIPLIKLNWILYKLNPELIHCHDIKGIGLLLPPFRKRTVLTIHEMNIQNSDFVKYRKCFAISEAVKKDILARYDLKAELIYNGIFISEIICREQKENKPEIFRIVQVGRLEHQKKGQHLLIEALNSLVNEHKVTNIHLDIIGNGSSLQFLKDIVNQYNLNGFINFLGEKDREFIYQNLCKYNLLVQPSLFEGFGLTVAEAMAAKVPVLVSDANGPVELIKDGVYGYHFKSGDMEDLTRQIMKIRTNYMETKELTEKAYKYTCENFDISITVENYLKQYRQITAKMI